MLVLLVFPQGETPFGKELNKTPVVKVIGIFNRR